MKKILPTSLCFMLLLLTICACNSHTASIKGEIKNAGGQKLYFEELNIATRKLLDSAKLGDNGNFSFKYKFKNDEPMFIILRTDSVTLATLLLEKGETVNFNADFRQPSKYNINGSEGSALVQQLNNELSVTIKKFDSLNTILMQSQGAEDFDTVLEEIDYASGAIAAKHKQALIRFIIRNPQSYASINAIYQKLPGDIRFFGKATDVNYYKILADSLSARYPNSAYVQILKDDYENLQKLITMQNLVENAEIAEGVPEIELPDTDRKMVKLSSLRGKFVLIDFWAPSNKEMLMLNRELAETYEKYNTRGFEVYQISEEKDRDIWLQAINNQQLKWINVMDTQTSQAASLYNVTHLPSNYLIDKSGQIIGKNLYGDALDKKLNEALPAK